jgi:hypothetical protein
MRGKMEIVINILKERKFHASKERGKYCLIVVVFLAVSYTNCCYNSRGKIKSAARFAMKTNIRENEKLISLNCSIIFRRKRRRTEEKNSKASIEYQPKRESHRRLRFLQVSPLNTSSFLRTKALLVLLLGSSQFIKIQGDYVGWKALKARQLKFKKTWNWDFFLQDLVSGMKKMNYPIYL